ncbi:tyrosine-type recombinase/integrase [Bradyrhizobium cytisi]|uniref:Tyrosine-type recombinase/integrase n=1 Tax=Bradyrhizobium cytisi TaxID=515489 RepID=A0A5S4VZ76_9BRAD|nr:tyrosine-type recombinase/integrase [Bradyrhizobium cytisi]TYL70872.1 tyrosine-type recombinase/integrase [Bradyrhizobium cytisi]
MTKQGISPLRQRMIEDMAIRKFVPKTQHDYVQRVKDFAVFLGRSPDTAKSEDVRGFRLHLASSGAGAPKINATVSALRFFFNVTLDRPDLAKHLSFIREPRKVPVVLSPEEVARVLEAAPSVKHKAALSVAYGAGLRVSEVVSLKVSDVDSERMMLRVEQGKGRKDRHAMLSRPSKSRAFTLPIKRTATMATTNSRAVVFIFSCPAAMASIASQWSISAGPGCLNRISASISGASAGVRLPCGMAAG